MTRDTVIVWGLLASAPFGGMIWQIYHYLIQLRRFGFDVWYVEDSKRYLFDPVTYGPAEDHTANANALAKFMDGIGFSDRWVFGRSNESDVCVGALDRAGLNSLYQTAAAAFNICGAQEFHEEYADIDCLVYIETDPVQKQVDVAKGKQEYIDELDAYDFLFSYGENLGNNDCLAPIVRYDWLPTRPPVCVELWQSNPPALAEASLTSVANWKHKGKDVTWQEETWHWSKHIEFLKFHDLPLTAALPMELAVGAIDDLERARLHQSGWNTIASIALEDPLAYRSYIQNSLGEFTVAKEQYVKPRSGWFSDRSVCYLAAGRPVITQDTGFNKFIPTGEGLFSYQTKDEALEAIQVIAGNYPYHSRKALEIAHEYFSDERVIGSMLSKVGLL